MKKFLIAFLLALVPTLALAQAGMLRVTADRTAVRDKPAADGSVVVNIVRGDQLQILETSGTWFRVRVVSTGREGFVHSLFVERVAGTGGGAAPAGPTAAPAPAPAPAPSPAPASASTSSSQGGGVLSGNGTTPMGDRKFGAGLMGSGYGFVPSIRYWFDGKMGAEVNLAFSSYAGYSTIAINPNLIVRFKEPQVTESVTFNPYFGGGVTILRGSSDYRSAYCGEFIDCSDSAIGFGGFVGAEAVFPGLPQLPISGNVGFFSSSYGYGGLYIGVGLHYYFGS